VTDGQEYLAEYLGALPIVMDNLIAKETIQPAVAVFIDPRDPITGTNRRAEQYLANFQFADFVADELVPRIDATYRTSPLPKGRTILGTSYGGTNSAFFGVIKGEMFGDNVFGNIALQSPVLVPELINLYRDFPLQSLNIFMSGGTLGDDTSSDAMAEVLGANGYSFEYFKVNEGHSWGAWRGQLDEMLIAMVGSTRVPEPTSLLLAALVGIPFVVHFRRHSRVT
jgi:enterochelin esterase family protein